jgi:hypothetical protein
VAVFCFREDDAFHRLTPIILEINLFLVGCEESTGLRMRDRILLDGGVHNDPLEIFGPDRPSSLRPREAFL